MKKPILFKGINLFLLLILLNSLSLTSCRQAVKQGIKKGGKYLAAAVLMVAVEEVLAGDMLDMFDEAPNGQEPIQVTINNQFDRQVIVGLSKDGKYWEERVIAPNQDITYTSSDKGLIGVKSGDKFFMLKEGQNFKVVQKGGKFVLEELGAEEKKESLQTKK